MESEIFDIINKTGYQVKKVPVTIDVISEYIFSMK